MDARVASVWVFALCAACGGTEAQPEPQPEPDPVFDYPLDDALRLHHVQAKSTHNSYHVESEGNELPDWAYTHLPLDRQAAEQGVRHFELDLWFDADAGVFEAIHVPLLDEESNCRDFTDCLRALKSWSDGHRAHHPLVVQIELKDPTLPTDMEAYFTALHNVILGVWPIERILTPAEVQGAYPSLGEAVATDGWPTLGGVRGHILFTLDDSGDWQRAYTFDRTSLDGRLMFAHASVNDAFAAVAVINEPLNSADAITAAVAANMLVRTRADSGGVEAMANDTTRQEAALASGAQFVTTDFPAPVAEHEYWLDLPDGTPSRCNPVTAPGECTALAIEDPAFFP